MLVQLHTTTLKMANEVLIKIHPGQRIEHRGSDIYKWSVQKEIVFFPNWPSLFSDQLCINQPAALSPREVEEFIAARNNLYERERLPDNEIYSAYRRLLSLKISP